MDKNINFFEFSDPAESMQGVIQLEPEKKSQPPPATLVSPAPPPATSSIEKYKSFCDVDTGTVLLRLKKTLWPFDRRKFLENKADLYGAFWVPTTLIFLLSVSTSLSAFFSGVIYFFIFSVPALLSFIILAGIEITFTELMSLYGYSYFSFWIAAILSVFNYSWVR